MLLHVKPPVLRTIVTEETVEEILKSEVMGQGRHFLLGIECNFPVSLQCRTADQYV
jgi:hypothetical protein